MDQSEASNGGSLLGSDATEGRGAQQSVFSFRAEFPADVDEFYAACAEAGIVTTAPSKRELQAGFADVAVEFRSASEVTVDDLRAAASDVPDLHVILETLRPVPLAENSLERQEFTRQAAGDTASAQGEAALSPDQRRWIEEHVPSRSAPRNGYGLEL